MFFLVVVVHSSVSYRIVISDEGYDGPQWLEEAIEFAMRVNISDVYGPWVPLRLTWRRNDTNSTTNDTNSTTNETIRGYDVETHGVTSAMVTQQVTVCGESLLPTDASEVQFRWMNTADQPGMWDLFNVTAKFTISGRHALLLDANQLVGL